jgi:glutamyl-tRNA reductase
VNRNHEKATGLVKEFGCDVYGLNDLTTVLAHTDVVFSATSSTVPVVNKAMMTDVMLMRQNRPMMLLDIAVPRDIEPAIANIPNVNLYCIDDLKSIIENNRKGREHAAEKAFEMIQKKSTEFLAELQSLDKVAHAISAYRGQIEELCRIELLKAKQQLHQGSDSLQVLDGFAHAFTKKLMHAPSVQLRQAGAEGRFELLRFAKQLFSLPDPETELL